MPRIVYMERVRRPEECDAPYCGEERTHLSARKSIFFDAEAELGQADQLHFFGDKGKLGRRIKGDL